MGAKKLTVCPVEKDHSLYDLMHGLVSKHHPHIKDARIVLVWRYGWREDVDGGLKLGTATKASDLNAQLGDYDFAISLNHDVLNSADWQEAQTVALLDHELCHCTYAVDEDGVKRTDETGRTVWRLRKHDIEEFREVIERNGLYKADLVKFAESIADAKPLPLFEDAEAA